MRRPFEPYSDGERQSLITQAKRHLRSRMRALRQALPESARRERSAAIAERIVELERFTSARTIAAFMAIHGEVDLTPVRVAAEQRGLRVVLPRVEPETDELVLHEARDEELAEGAYGIAEPPASAPVVALEEVDLVLVPALVVDLRGFRVGYGKGYYDRLLATAPSVPTCAVVFDFQLVGEAPCEAHDRPVDWVVTDRQSFATAPPTP